MTYHSSSPQETQALGRALAKLLQPGDIIAFTGDLGAGKTTLTQGIALGLDISAPLTSPTYTIIQEYLEGRLPLFHFDLYRLGGEEELFDLGFEEYFHREGICILEWSEIAGDSLQDLGLLITLDLRQGLEEGQRCLTLDFPDQRQLFFPEKSSVEMDQ